MARVEWVEQRLLNWARWKLGGGGEGRMGYAAVKLGGPNAGRSGYVTAAVPVLEAEASATDDAVNRLTPAGLSLTVHRYYLDNGGHQEKAQALGISVATLYARIERAHVQLAVDFQEQRERRQRERDRVEALASRGSFPR